MRHSFKKFFIAAMGPGEISQGMAFASYAISRGVYVSFAVLRREHLAWIPLENKNFKPLLLEVQDDLWKELSVEKSDVLVLCNSKIFGGDKVFLEKLPLSKPYTVSLDSNWLFHPKSPYLSVKWVDRYFINIPPAVFRLGLKKFGGRYVIHPFYEGKIKIIGLLPSYHKITRARRSAIRKKYGIKRGDKLMFLYTSVGGMGKPEVFKRALEAVRMLRVSNYDIKVVYLGKLPENFKKESWVFTPKHTNTEEFYEILSSSDLVFQHQGLGTLEQAIAANIPVIANIKDLKDEPSKYHAHAWEVGPFARYGACAMFYFRDPLSGIADKMRALLYNEKARSKMIHRQKKLYSSGEKKMFNEIIKNLKTR